MKANELCPAPHLEAADLNGQDVVVTIAKVAREKVGNEQVDKGVVFFTEFPRGLVLNRTNVKRIIAMYGNETDVWVGKPVTFKHIGISAKNGVPNSARIDPDNCFKGDR